MGTRFSTRPCATCREDTMHIGARCNTCGTMWEQQAFRRALTRVYNRVADERGEEAAKRKLFGIRERMKRARTKVLIDHFGYSRKMNRTPSQTVFGKGSGRPSIK